MKFERSKLYLIPTREGESLAVCLGNWWGDDQGRLGGKTRRMRVVVDEPEPGYVLNEISLDTDSVTTFEVEPLGNATLVRISTEWSPAAGISGWVATWAWPAGMASD